MLAKQNCTKT